MSKLLILFPIVVISHALHVEAQEQQDTQQAQPISKGSRAPFEGILFPSELAIKLGFRIETLEKQLKLEVAREKNLCEANLGFARKTAKLELSRREYEIEKLAELSERQQKQLDQGIPWHKTWSFGVIVGFISSAVLVVGAAFIINSLKSED